MNEKPIIYNSKSINLILDEQKTHTRRIVKPQPDEDGLSYNLIEEKWFDTSGKFYRCPYGKRGDHLWVRETWKTCSTVCSSAIYYKADNLIIEKDYPAPKYSWPWTLKRRLQWQSPIFMPRWASRITLKVLDIKVERLHQMDGYDVKKEGFRFGDFAKFVLFWNLINAKRGYAWDKNPWVFVLSFRKI